MFHVEPAALPPDVCVTPGVPPTSDRVNMFHVEPYERPHHPHRRAAQVTASRPVRARISTFRHVSRGTPPPEVDPGSDTQAFHVERFGHACCTWRPPGGPSPPGHHLGREDAAGRRSSAQGSSRDTSSLGLHHPARGGACRRSAGGVTRSTWNTAHRVAPRGCSDQTHPTISCGAAHTATGFHVEPHRLLLHRDRPST